MTALTICRQGSVYFRRFPCSLMATPAICLTNGKSSDFCEGPLFSIFRCDFKRHEFGNFKAHLLVCNKSPWS